MSSVRTEAFPLGRQSPPSVYRERRDVIGEVGKSAAGNTIIRIGRESEVGGWEQVAHVVLTPDERGALIAALTEQLSD